MRLRNSRLSVKHRPTPPPEDERIEPPKEMAKVFKAADNRGGRIRSLFIDPVLQGSSRSHMGTTPNRGAEFPSSRNAQEHGKTTDLPKDEAKEGTGFWLLNMLRRTLRGSESKELEVTPEAPNLVPFGDVVGCLAVRIKNCRHFTPKISWQHYNNLFIRISINNIVKCTKIRSLLLQNKLYSYNEKNAIIKFDEVKYFSVQVPRRQDDERNNIYLELMQNVNKEKYPLLLGSVQVHLYEVIQKRCFTEEFQMLNKNTFICRMEVEFMFSYGNFGYGYSHQLKPLQKIIEPSMFMNIAPPPERTDPETNVIIPQPIEYPAFLSPDLNVTQPNQPSVVRLEKLQQQPRERLEKMKKEYRDLSTWREKATYLEGVLNPKLEHSRPKESNTNEILESKFEEGSEDILTSDVSFIKEEAETIPSELLHNDDMKDLSLPTSNQSNQDNLIDVAPKSDESTKQTDTLLHIIPSLTITEENKILPLEEYSSEDMMDRKMKNVLFQPGVKLKDKYTGILKNSSSSEGSYHSLSTMNKNLKVPNNKDGLMRAQSYRQLNTNKKGKSVAFSEKEHIVPSLRSEYIDFQPKYQFLNSNIKDGFDPFLRNLNNKMSVGKRKDQDMCKCRDILSADIVELEDQDPPHPTHSKSASPIKEVWPHGFDSATMKTVDTKKKLIHDPAIITIKTLSTKDKLKERLPNVSLPNFEGVSSLTENVNVHACRLSKSLSFTSHIENLKQAMVLKSILSKNLQDLSDKLFSQTEVSVDTEARKKSHSSPLLSVRDNPLSNLEDDMSDKVQGLNNWLSKGDILNSESFISPVIKDISVDSLSESGSGNSPEVERELVSKKYLEASEIAFSIKKKSSFKKKHLESEVSSSKLRDFVIKQIFTVPAFSKLKIGVEESRETQMNSQDQYPAAWESLSSDILVHSGENDGEIELPEDKSVISQIIEAFPVDTLLESGIIKVIELNKEHQKSSLLHTETAFAEEKPKDSTEDYLEIKSKTDPLSKQIIPTIPKETTSFFNRVEFIDNGQNISPENSKSQSTPDKNTDLPSNGQRLDREENDISPTLENLSNLLMDKYNESDIIMLKSFLKNIFNVFFKYNLAERGQPEKELERLIQHPFPNNTKDPEETKENFDKADKLRGKPSLSPKLRIFLEELSESEIENFKSELSKHIQHYLVERLSESGLVTREDLTKIYQNLYLMNEEAEPKGQNVFLEKYSETVKETMSFVNNFNHHFIDKHLEIKLRSFLNEILQNYFLKNLSESSFSKETESEPIHSNTSSLRTESASVSFQELGQSISRGSFGRRLEVNMKYPLNKFLQGYLTALSENELLDLKGDLSKYLQRLFTEKLSQSGLITEKQLEGISHHINLNISSSTPLKYIKPDLSFRDENPFMDEHSEKQNKYSKIVHKTTLPKVPEKSLVETELTRKEEKEYFFLQNIQENPSIIREQKKYHLKEGAKTLTLIKVQTSSNKNTQAIPLKKSSERLTDIVFKKGKKEHGFMQLPQAENFDFKTEIQDPHNLSGKSKITQSNVCFERTLKMMPLEKKHNIYKLMVQEKPEVLSPHPRIPFCKMPNEDEEYVDKFTFSSRQNNSLTHFNSEAGENSKLDRYCQRMKGYNNNNKKHLITFSHYEKEIQALYIKPSEIYNEKCATVLASQLFKVVEAQKKSKPFLFPEVLKKEYLKPKVQKERNHVSKQKKSFNKIVKILPTAPPTTRILKKSVPRTLLHWTARRTVHDCLDKSEDLRGTSFQHLEKAKSRARLSGKSSDDNHYRLKHTARPYTAPEVSKRRESYSGKRTNPRMVSAGLVHLNVTVPDNEIQKMRPPPKLKC